MTAEQEAIERLRAWMPHVDRGISWTTSHQADLRALLDSHERLREALEEIRDLNQQRCPACGMGNSRMHYEGCSLRAALEGNNE